MVSQEREALYWTMYIGEMYTNSSELQAEVLNTAEYGVVENIKPAVGEKHIVGAGLFTPVDQEFSKRYDSGPAIVGLRL